MNDKPRVYRSRVLLVAGVLLAAIPIGMWVLWLVYNDGSAGSLVCPLAVSWLPPVCWLWLVRPRLLADSTGVTIVQPLRTTNVPWAQIRKFDSLEVLYVHRRDDLPSLRVAGLGTSNVYRVAGKQGHADRVARDLNAMLARYWGGRQPQITADTATGLKKLRLTPWHSAYPISGMLMIAGMRWEQYWMVLLGPILAVAATLALRKSAKPR